MALRFGLVVFLLLVLLASSLVGDARRLVPEGVSGLEISGRRIDLCTTCEEYTTLALDYISQQKTQNEILESLHKACLRTHGLAKQCTELVNYYVPNFFLEVSSIQPEGFCKKIELCNDMVSSVAERRNKCDLCHSAVDEALEKLKDPDTKLEVIQMLLKACNSVGSYTKKCKSLVFEFGPIILVDAEKFIESADLCTTFHACTKPSAVKQQESVEGRIEMVTSS